MVTSFATVAVCVLCEVPAFLAVAILEAAPGYKSVMPVGMRVHPDHGAAGQSIAQRRAGAVLVRGVHVLADGVADECVQHHATDGGNGLAAAGADMRANHAAQGGVELTLGACAAAVDVWNPAMLGLALLLMVMVGAVAMGWRLWRR